MPGSGSKHDLKTLGLRITVSMRKQFNLWSKAFRSDFQKVHVRFMVGEALAFCTNLELVDQGNPFTYARQWTSIPMKLDGGNHGDIDHSVPRLFNVIDTSNLADNLGLLNVLVAVLPLLRKEPDSTLFTERLHIKNYEFPESEDFESQLFADQSTMFLLLGIVPVAHLFGHSPRSTTLDCFCRKFKVNRDGVLWHRITWKIPTLGENDMNSFRIDAKDAVTFPLAIFLFEIYVQMFADESRVPDPDFIVRYTRAGFAKFVLFLQSRIEADWMASFMDMVTFDSNSPTAKLKWERLGVDELYLQLHLHGLRTVDCLKEPLHTKDLLPLSRYPEALGAETTREMVYINLVVPRAKLHEIEQSQKSRQKWSPQCLGSPNFRIHILAMIDDGQHVSLQCHSSVQLCFGKIDRSSSSIDEIDEIIIDEDKEGWDGDNDLIVWFVMSSKELRRFDPTNIVMCLNYHKSPGVSHGSMAWEKDDTIFATSLANKDGKAFVTANPPNLSLVAIQESSVRDTGDFEHDDRGNAIKYEGPIAVFDECSTFVNSIAWYLTLSKDSTVKNKDSEVLCRPLGLCGLEVSAYGESIALQAPYPITKGMEYNFLESGPGDTAKRRVEVRGFPTFPNRMLTSQ